MSSYLKWNEQIIADFSDENINTMYDRGFVFTRPGRGVMQQTRSVRINLSKFELSSENKRILRKIEDLRLKIEDLPYGNYSWEIGKMAKDFYDTKFGKNTLSANKVREIMTDENFKNFNKLLVYSVSTTNDQPPTTIGYCIIRETSHILHYSYPFYSLLITHYSLPNTGMGMMLRAIEYAKQQNKKHIYLGSFQRPTDTYKLQFAGLEWFDGERWSEDLGELKKIIQDL
jgi:arginyl-tRNA--protein-N-Asp/Glu arginylyltransferase